MPITLQSVTIVLSTDWMSFFRRLNLSEIAARDAIRKVDAVAGSGQLSQRPAQTPIPVLVEDGPAVVVAISPLLQQFIQSLQVGNRA